MDFKKTPDDLTKINPGIYSMSDEEYFSKELSSVAVSQSTFKKINKDSILKIIKDSEKEDTTALRIGKGAHCLILEGQSFYESKYFLEKKAVSPPTQKDFIAKGGEVDVWKKLRAAYNTEVDCLNIERIKAIQDKKTILTQAESDVIKTLKVGASNSKIFQEKLKDSMREFVIIFDMSGYLIKTKIDIYSPDNGGELIDYKTSPDVSNDKFYWDSKKFEYIFQFAVYRFALLSVDLPVARVISAVGSKSVAELAMYEISIDWVKSRGHEVVSRLERYHEEIRDFKNSKTRYDEIIPLKDPREENLDEIFKPSEDE